MTRFTVTYRIFAADLAEARDRARGVAVEQTVEVPEDVVPPGFVADEIVGRVEEIGTEAEGRFRATISYSPHSAGHELSQYFNVIFGNSSWHRGLRVVGIDPGAEMMRRHPGPRFGIAGVRRLCGRPQGGLIAPVLKPQGLDAGTLAQIAERCVHGGADIVKEDHGITDQPMARFAERVEKVAAAVSRANARTGRQALYFPSLPGHVDRFAENLRHARAAGAHGVLVMPGLLGFGVVARIAADESLSMPVMTHPAFLGPYVLSPDTGFDFGVMFGTLQRLAGSDISVFPNVGGRFGFSAADCRAIADGCRAPAGPGRPILPSPGGGMTVERAPELGAFFGPDAVHLLGGSLLRLGAHIGEGIAQVRAALDAAEARLAEERA